MPLRVLIVEDEPIVALDLEAIAIARGHEVVGVAERLSDVRALADSQLDLAFVDMNLRDGRTGRVVADHLRRGHDTMVIFVTANIEQIPLDFCGALGAVAKPFTEAAMAEVIDFAAAVRAKARIDQTPSALLLPKYRGQRLF